MKKNRLIVNVIYLFICLSIYLYVGLPIIHAQTTPTPTPANYDFLLHLLNTFINPGTMQQSSFDFTTSSATLFPSSILQQNLSSTINPLSSSFTYYPQCDGIFDNLPLPNGCTLCRAGCGPTTLAMILSSYVDKKFTPDVVVNLYKQNGYYAGCDGTKITDAMNIATQNGLKTTDLLVYDGRNNDNAIQDFKAYINSGWTIFTLARYCAAGCRHFFWITNVDSQNNVWAYDSFYGRKRLPPPFNENQYYPFPQYKFAFGVKK